MIGHGILNLVWLLALVYGLAAAYRRSRKPAPARTEERGAARRPIPEPWMPVRRLSQAPILPPVVAARARPGASTRRTPPPAPEAVAAFPGVDLSLPDAGGLLQTASTGRRGTQIAGAAAFGSPAWAAGAIVGAEILGPPLALRPGATFGAPRAF
jgi:hypothetical protein